MGFREPDKIKMAWTEITRAQYLRDDMEYASDLGDGEWALIVWPRKLCKPVSLNPEAVHYRAADKDGDTIDFYLSPPRNAKATKRFLGKAVNGLKD